jgi:LacI family transcriptional regulator
MGHDREEENQTTTIYDVAEEAGVSHATVTRYFGNPDKLSPRTYQRVRRAARALGYVPNAAARSLNSGRTNLVALVIPDITSAFYTSIMYGVEEKAQEGGYTLTVANTDQSAEKERALVQALVSHRVDGVILAAAPSEEHGLDPLSRHDVSVVQIDRELPETSYDFVRGDSFEAGRLLTSHFLDEGFRDIAFVGGAPGVSSLEQRLAGYRQTMEEVGADARVRLGSYDQESGEETMDQLVTDETLPEAILAASNKVALGVLVAARRHGVSIPGDVGLACVDDIEAASLIDPFLTVAAQPAYEIGQTAMEMLAERIEGSTRSPRQVVLPVELIVRRSSLNVNGESSAAAKQESVTGEGLS